MLGTAASAGADDVAQGRQIYLEYCSSCHGLTGEGDGPVAPALTTPPANLRRLSERFGNPLPEDQFARFIDGRVEVKAHGPRDMPVWGARFYAETHNESSTVCRPPVSLYDAFRAIEAKDSALTWYRTIQSKCSNSLLRGARFNPAATALRSTRLQ